MWRGERRGIDNGPAVRQRGGICVCVCETEEGVVRGRAGDISRKLSGQALCGAALGGCGGVYILLCVCVCVCVCVLRGR